MPRGIKRKEVVINFSHDYFWLSRKALDRLSELEHRPVSNDDYLEPYVSYGIRHDKNLIVVVKELGEEVNEGRADIRVVKIPGTKYRIFSEGNYGEREWIETPEEMGWIEIKEEE